VIHREWVAQEIAARVRECKKNRLRIVHQWPKHDVERLFGEYEAEERQQYMNKIQADKTYSNFTESDVTNDASKVKKQKKQQIDQLIAKMKEKINSYQKKDPIKYADLIKQLTDQRNGLKEKRKNCIFCCFLLFNFIVFIKKILF